MKKSYIPPKSNLYVLKLDENIASSIGSGGGDSMSGLMVILFSNEITPCRQYYTGSSAAVNTVGPNGTFMEYFLDMQEQGAPISCMTSN